MATSADLFRAAYTHGVKLAMDRRLTGALIGGGLGAGAGALLDTEHRARGAAVGGIGGALAGTAAGSLMGPQAATIAEPTLEDFKKWNDARKISLLREHKGKIGAMPAAVRAPMQEWIDGRLKI